ncbi:ABC-2 family transporter protein [Peptococcaceae bacterium CEB3]|nr:ABC-2 family transporter protein [Peptococcaceae bacterium CEB3]
MLTILRLTIKEVVRRKILHVTILLSLLFLALFGIGVRFAYTNLTRNLDPLRFLIVQQFFVLGLFFGSFLVSFLTVMTAVGAISAEIESGTILAILPHPIRRSDVILGKFFGYALLLAIFSLLYYTALSALVTVLTGLPLPYRLFPVLLFTLQPLILLSVTIYGTTLLPTLANGIAVFMLYAVGWLGGMIEQVGYLLKNGTLIHLGILSSLIMPADALYRKIIATVQSGAARSLTGNFLGPFGVQAEPSVWMLLYTGLYILCFVLAAVGRFNRRDI